MALKPIIEFEMLTTETEPPRKFYETSIGYDISMPDFIHLEAGQMKKVNLEFKMRLPDNYFARLEIRSSWAYQNVVVEAG